jgi:hypothetical protein
MTNERFKEIEVEAKKRLDLWLQNSSFTEMTACGSYMRFSMALGLRGYPLEKQDWMNESDFNIFITDEEYDSPQYDEILEKLYKENWFSLQ